DGDVHGHVAQVAAHDLGRAGVIVHHEQAGALHRITILQSAAQILSNASLRTHPSMSLARRMRVQPPPAAAQPARWPAWSLGPSRPRSSGVSRRTTSSATTTPISTFAAVHSLSP